MAEGSLSGQQVWVLQFTTRHGTEIHVFSSEKYAERGGIKLIREHLDELEQEDAIKIEAALRERRWKDALDLFHRSQEDLMDAMILELNLWVIDGFLHGTGPKEWFPG